MRKTLQSIWPILLVLTLGVCVRAQQPDKPEPLSIVTTVLPHGSMWEPYGGNAYQFFELRYTGGVAPYHWRIINGALPRALNVHEHGELSGTPQESGTFQFILEVRDSNNPPARAQKKFTLIVEPPLTVEWDRKAQVNGQRIDGSVKVSNHTGRDFDLTFVVLAVNEIGRATAIGYQHFPLKRDTRDLSLPFGDTLPPGNYAVNLDLVGEEPVSKKIFRTRLVTPKETITQGP